MDVRVDGKVLLITGGTQGIGRATALEAGRSGASGIVVTGAQREARRRSGYRIAALGVLGVGD